MLEQASTSIRVTIVTLVLTGLLYPLAVTGVAGIAFPRRAGGSIVLDASGRAVGSELLAQGFSSPAYFQPRPSAAGEKGFDPMASGGSNLGPTSAKLRDRCRRSW
jgi:K+-transporting ATPase ATPase C chain